MGRKPGSDARMEPKRAGKASPNTTESSIVMVASRMSFIPPSALAESEIKMEEMMRARVKGKWWR